MSTNNIRNFCIIAHIDHGKSTLADRLLEEAKTISKKEMKDQVLDSMELERERGITIKSHPIRLEYTYIDDVTYILNLIDTPGHVDFSYEVSRSLAACEGALLLVDAAQGVEAQTVSNAYLAIENGLTIIPVINKVDLSSAMIEEVTVQVLELIGCEENEIIYASAKSGIGIDKIFSAIIEKINPPKERSKKNSRALIFDSTYDNYRGAIPYVRVFDGVLKAGMKAKFFAHDKEYEITETGYFVLDKIKTKQLKSGEVGYIVASIRDMAHIEPGDTITTLEKNATESLPGYKKIKPMVFSGLYPADTDYYDHLRQALEKLKLNDASLEFIPETSEALGFGFRCGFLGLLHLEIIQERLEREFDMSVITTVPNVSYHAFTKKKPDEIVLVNNPTDLPEPSALDHVKEPFIKASVITKADYVGNVMSLCIEKRGQITNQTYLTPERVELSFDMPLAEIVFDFYDRLKSVSRGYASFDYSSIGLRTSKLVKVDILLNGNAVDALSALVHADNAYALGKKMCEKLKELIPRQQFDIPIQAAIGAKIISRETIKAVRKDVTAKCYGGDITRKRKLLEKQKKGKKKMRQVGNVEIPQQAFMAVLQLND